MLQKLRIITYFMTALARSEVKTESSLTLPIETSVLQTHQQVIERIDLFKASGESSLDLSKLGLLEVPKEIIGLPLLSKLDLSHNKITALPHDPAFFERIRRLDLSCNSIEIFPEELCALEGLHSLDLHANKLAMISHKIASMTSLLFLDLSLNPLITFPFESFTYPGLLVELRSTSIPVQEQRDFLAQSAIKKSLSLDTSLFILDV